MKLKSMREHMTISVSAVKMKRVMYQSDSESTDVLELLHFLLADTTCTHGLGAGNGTGVGAVVR